MIKHVIIWSFRDDLSTEEKAESALKIKHGLEGLVGVIEGMQSAVVYIEPLPSGNGDMLLDSAFTDIEALAYYQQHPEHQRVAQYVRSVVKSRLCMDYAQ